MSLHKKLDDRLSKHYLILGFSTNLPGRLYPIDLDQRLKDVFDYPTG